MSTQNDTLGIFINGHVKIVDETTGKVLLDKDNAIHSQNMARIISRKLANEDNSVFYRIAFGDGGTFVDAGLNVTAREPNDGTNGGGWESRLYREIYSEIIDNSDPNFGTDPGSAGPDNVRVGGGASPSGDPSGLGVSSEEIGRESNTIVNMTINESEPFGEDLIFDEIGLYSSGRPAVDTAGTSSINIGDNKTSISTVSGLAPNTSYGIVMVIDGVSRSTTILTPLTGTGPSGSFTYGDICEGINTGSWYSSGYDLTASDGAFFFITDDTGGDYPSITGQNSAGLLTVQSKTIGSTSSIEFTEDGGSTLIFLLAGDLWSRANINKDSGLDAGLINGLGGSSSLERERLLTHIVFEPITKASSSIIRITYTITVSVLDCIL
jgi:hypothetical protein